MRKVVVLLVISMFLVATAKPALARRQQEGVSWEALVGIGIIAAVLGYGIHAKSQIQQKDLDNERYSKDHDGAIAAARVLKPGEAVETDTSRPGHRRLQKTGSIAPEPQVSVDMSQLRRQNPAIDSEPEVEHIAYSPYVNGFGLDELESASRAFDSFGATSRERLAVLHVLEEAADEHQTVYTRGVLRADKKYLYSLNEKVSNVPAEHQAVQKLIRYLDVKVFGGAS